MIKKYAPRGPKVNPEQREILAGYMLGHVDFASGRFTGGGGVAVSRKIWSDLADILNQKGQHKTVDQWKKCWKDMKRRSRGKVTAIRLGQNCTGNLPNETAPLTNEDKKILSVIGSDAIENIKGVPDSTPETVAELRQLIAGDRTPLAVKPVEGVRIFDKFNINVKGSKLQDHVITNEKLKQSTQTHSRYSSPINTYTTYPPTTAMPSTHTVNSNTPTCSSPTLMSSILSFHTHTPPSPSFEETYTNIDMPSNSRSANHINPSENPCSKLKSISNSPTKLRTKRQCEAKAVGFMQLQSEQNKILETMAAAMLLAAENERKMIEIAKEGLEIKLQKIEEQKKFNARLGELFEILKKN